MVEDFRNLFESNLSIYANYMKQIRKVEKEMQKE
jgi:hypothetical protein